MSGENANNRANKTRLRPHAEMLADVFRRWLKKVVMNRTGSLIVDIAHLDCLSAFFSPFYRSALFLCVSEDEDPTG